MVEDKFWEQAKEYQVAPSQTPKNDTFWDEVKDFELPAGSHPATPLQEGALSAWERHQVMNYAPNPESAVRWLKKNHPDWEVVQYGPGYKISVQKPGEPWKVVDPQGFDMWDVGDIVSDVGVGVTSAIGGTIGGILGTGTANPVGTFGGAALGSAGGAAVGEAGRQGIGALMGFEAPLSERATEVGISAATGLVAEGAGRVLGGVGKAALAKIPASVKQGVKGLTEKATRGTGHVLEKGGKLAQVPERGPAWLMEKGTTLTSSAKGAQKDLATKLTTAVDDLGLIVEKVVPDTAKQEKLRGLISTAKDDLAQGWVTTAERKEVLKRLQSYKTQFKEAIDIPSVPNAKDILDKAFKVLTETASAAPASQSLPFLGRLVSKFGPSAYVGTTVGGLPGLAVAAAYKVGTLTASALGKKMTQIGRLLIDNPQQVIQRLQRIPGGQRFVYILNKASNRGPEALKATAYMLLNDSGFRRLFKSDFEQEEE